MDLSYKKIKEGDSWGEKWESAWFHLKGEVPKSWSGKQIAADLDFSGEGLVFNNKGIAIQGITNGAIWDSNFARTRVPFIDKCTGGEKIELWVETAANSLFGVFTDPDPEEQSPKRHGWFDAKVEKMQFGIFDNFRLVRSDPSYLLTHRRWHPCGGCAEPLQVRGQRCQLPGSAQEGKIN